MSPFASAFTSALASAFTSPLAPLPFVTVFGSFGFFGVLAAFSVFAAVDVAAAALSLLTSVFVAVAADADGLTAAGGVTAGGVAARGVCTGGTEGAGVCANARPARVAPISKAIDFFNCDSHKVVC